MGISAAPHLRQVRVIGPIWPTARRPTIEWAAQISVVRTSSRIGFAQTDWMSPVLGAVASVIFVLTVGGSARRLSLGRWPGRAPALASGGGLARGRADGLADRLGQGFRFLARTS